MDSAGTVDVTFRDNIAILSMNCGQNRLNKGFVKKMNEALDKVERNPDITAMVTTSTGKYFSNGLDLEWMTTADKEVVLNFFRKDFPALLVRFLTFPMPTIAAINGHAYAAGFLISLSHDYRVMRTGRGWMCMNEVRINLPFTDFLMTILRTRLPGGNVFHEIIALGKPFGAEEAKEAGIISIACDESDLMKNAFSIANNVLKPGPYDRASMKNMKEDMFKHIIALQQEHINISKL